MATLGKVLLSIGVDLGQRRDPTAISVVELVDVGRPGGPLAWSYEARHIERLPLGTRYGDVADRLAEIQRNAVQAVRERPLPAGTYQEPDVYLRTWIDATGAVPALDMFRERWLDVTPCFFTHGDRRTEAGDQVTIGKAWLVNRLQSLAQSDRLLLPPNHREAAAMMRELQDYEIRLDTDANDKYGAFRVGTHDDLVTAVGLAVQWAPEYLTTFEDIVALFGR